MPAANANTLVRRLSSTKGKFLRGSDATDANPNRKLGDAQPAQEGFQSFVVIENEVGMEGKNAANFNEALLTHGGPGLQAAIDGEGTKQMNCALKKMGEELEKETALHWA